MNWETPSQLFRQIIGDAALLTMRELMLEDNHVLSDDEAIGYRPVDLSDGDRILWTIIYLNHLNAIKHFWEVHYNDENYFEGL